MKKRLLSALLALVMVLALLPVSVFADPSPTGEVQTVPNPDPVADDPADPDAPEEEGESEPAAQTGDAGTSSSSSTSLGSATDTHKGWRAEVITRANSDYGIGVGDIGKYAVHGKASTTDTKETYYLIDSGFVYNNAYYPSLSGLPTSVTGTLTSNIISIGSQTSCGIPGRIKSLTIEIFSGSLGITGHDALTGLTVKNSRNIGTQPTVAATSMSGLTSLTLENVDGSGISFNDTSSADHAVTINLTNAKLGAVTLKGQGTGTNSSGKSYTYDRPQKITAVRSTIGAIDLAGSGSIVKLTDCNVGDTTTASNITVKSNGGSITIDGGSKVGTVTVGAIDARKTYPTISIGGTATVGKITESENPSKGDATAVVTINGSGAEVALGSGENISFTSANITINAGKVGNITLDNGGKVYLNGTYITVGNLDLKGISQLQVENKYNANSAEGVNNGGHNTVGGIKVEKNCTLTIPADPTNTYGSTTENNNSLEAYTKKTILGGTWNFSVKEPALHDSLIFYLACKINNSYQYTYYTKDQLGAALNRQLTTEGSMLRVVGQTGYSSTYGEIRFMNGVTPWGVLQVTKPVQIVLPSMMNNVKLSSWTDGAHTYVLPNVYTNPILDKMNEETLTDGRKVKFVELNASGGVNTGDVTRLTNVAATAKNDYVAGSVRAALNGNVITLTGAVNPGTSMITLTLTTDAVERKTDNDTTKDRPVTLEVGVEYFSNTGTLIFEPTGDTALGKGMTLETVEGGGLGVLRLSNGTKYTLNGSGLKVRSDIKVANYDSASYVISNYSFIEVAVNAPTIKTDIDKQTVIDMFTKDNKDGFKWTDSPAIRQAINAALATITQQQVDNWLAQVQREAWTKVNVGTYNAAAHATDSGYDQVWLVPYLQVNVTNYSTNGTLTFTAVPSWRVEVRQSSASGDAYNTAFFDAKKPENNLTNPKGAKVVKAGTSLGTLTGSMGTGGDLAEGAELKINHGWTGVYLHQDNTYAYTDKSSVYTITHAGNSLGTMIINRDAPLVTLYKGLDSGTGKPTTVAATYDNLQAAVNDAKDGNHINVDQGYKGSMNVSVTGFARKFTIQANGNNVVLANASGGLVELNSLGGLYTVQLNRDTTAVVDETTATIAVNTAANGYAVVSATTAKSGTTITVTCTPAAGYRTNSVAVSAHMTKTNTNSAVTVTKVSDNVYSFKVPQGADTITVTPGFVLGTTSAAIPFTDVAANHWAYNSVKYVYDNGLMNGVNTAGTQFGGNQTLNRAMVVTILYRAAGSPYVGASNSFSDVPGSQWYTQAVAWANQNGIVTGYTNGTFQPNWAITREELSTILYRYNTTYKGRATTGSTTLTGFVDQGNVSNWATAGMQWAVGNGIVNGIQNGSSTTLSPSGSATRYEAATMLMRYGQGLGL